jgi:antitoxin (DNA-binding transcriptional repressor) of toxin-antitoxin stability system
MMRTVKISEFKEHCLSLLDTLDPEGLVVTKHGKPLARVLPFEKGGSHLIGSLKGKIAVKGSLLRTGLKWNAES